MTFPSSADDFGRELARILAIRRDELGLSKLALAQRAGLDQRTITFIERGTNSPNIKTLFVLCEALDLDISLVIAESITR